MLTTTTPRKACFPSPKQGSGAPKGACIHVRANARLRDLCGRRARLSALTLAALATGYHPDGSAPEPGFRDAVAARCFAGKPRRCAALSTLRADRSLCRSTGDPEPPGSGWQIRRAGTAPRSASTACLSGKAPYGEQGDGNVTGVGTYVKQKVSIMMTEPEARFLPTSFGFHGGVPFLF